MRARSLPHIVAAVAAILLLAAMLNRTTAALTGTDDNPDNVWNIASLNLDATPTTTAFNVAEVDVPDVGDSTCIDVAVSGSVSDPADVRLYLTAVADTNATSDNATDHVRLAVDVFPAGETCDTNGGSPATVQAATALSAFGANYDDGSAVTVWDPAPGDMERAVQLSWNLPDPGDQAVVDALEGVVAEASIHWEVQSQ